jgi:hypothetical protein
VEADQRAGAPRVVEPEVGLPVVVSRAGEFLALRRWAAARPAVWQQAAGQFRVASPGLRRRPAVGRVRQLRAALLDVRPRLDAMAIGLLWVVKRPA